MTGFADKSAAVDSWLEGALPDDDPALAAALERNAAAGLPPIDVSPLQGRMLELLVRISGAKRMLEIGTLGGYSTICLARGAGPQAQIITLEYAPRHAEVARANIEAAGLAGQIALREGAALELIDAMIAAGEAPFDLIFVDADKLNNGNYFERALKLSRPGTVLLFDNVVREGRIIDMHNTDPMLEGTRNLFARVRAAGLRATAVQTVGGKGWDGFLMAVVDG